MYIARKSHRVSCMFVSPSVPSSILYSLPWKIEQNKNSLPSGKIYISNVYLGALSHRLAGRVHSISQIFIGYTYVRCPVSCWVYKTEYCPSLFLGTRSLAGRQIHKQLKFSISAARENHIKHQEITGDEGICQGKPQKKHKQTTYNCDLKRKDSAVCTPLRRVFWDSWNSMGHGMEVWSFISRWWLGVWLGGGVCESKG